MSVATASVPTSRAVPTGASLRRSRRWALWTSYFFLILFAIFFLAPPYYMVVTALKSDEEYAIDKLGFPESPVLDNFRSVLVDSPFLHWMLNSAVLVAGAVILSTAVSVLGAYAIATMPPKELP